MAQNIDYDQLENDLNYVKRFLGTPAADHPNYYDAIDRIFIVCEELVDNPEY